MTERPSWRFYGRKKEMDSLAYDLEFQPDPHDRRGGRRQFSTFRVRGRRGTGQDPPAAGNASQCSGRPSVHLP